MTKKSPVLVAILAARSSMYIESSGENKSQGWTFANINDLYRGVIEPLKEQGCIIYHQRFIQDGVLCMRTTIEHIESGDIIEDICFIQNEKPGNQGIGIATTYMKKDAIRCLLALPSKDDDGQAEQEDIKKQSEKKADAYSVRRLEELIAKTKDPSKMINQVLYYNKIDTLHDIGEQQCLRAISRVEEILRTS